MISCLYRSVVPRSPQLGKTNASVTRRLGFSWEIFRTSWAEYLAVSHGEDQFETGLLETEYAGSALDVSSIIDRLG